MLQSARIKTATEDTDVPSPIATHYIEYRYRRSHLRRSVVARRYGKYTRVVKTNPQKATAATVTGSSL